MRWRVLTVLATAGVLVLAGTGPAFAKGADQATITGPGLAQAIVLAGEGEPGTSGDKLGQLANSSGLFLAMFGPSGGQHLVPTAPGGALGPRYSVAFRVPGGASTPDVVWQDLYPLAAGGPVTYTAADQTALGGRTTGGWYRAQNSFTPLLASIGVPGLPSAAASATAASGAAASGAQASGAAASGATDLSDAASATPWARAWIGVLVGAVLLVALAIVAAAIVVAARRRRQVTS